MLIVLLVLLLLLLILCDDIFDLLCEGATRLCGLMRRCIGVRIRVRMNARLEMMMRRVMMPHWG